MFVVPAWIERHCVVPDGFRRGRPFRPYDGQLEYLGAFYLVRGDARWVPENPVLAPAFVYRRGLLVGPQKLGKDPLMAAQVCVEGAGPALFAGWAEPGDTYNCHDHGCGCGWVYRYDTGEPRGMPWPTPLIQITAFSEKATENTYDALRPMIDDGPLADVIPRTGEGFIRLPGGGRIDTVTSEARSRLGNRITHASQGELGIWNHANTMDKVADTQWRGLAGTGGRASGTTNSWDPAERSVAQLMYESPAEDVYRQFAQPPGNLSFRDKVERKRILRIVYPPDVLRENGGHVDLNAIEAEAMDLIGRGDPAQAARFFGNMIITGSGRAFDIAQWDALKGVHTCKPGGWITLGFDGSKSGDWTALIATCVACGFQWSLGIWAPADGDGGEVPRGKVNAAVAGAFAGWKVWRLYADPPYWREEIAAWQGKYGDKVVIDWDTNRSRPIAAAVSNFAVAISDRALHHDGDPVYRAHIANCHRRVLPGRDEKGAHLWTLEKERPDSNLKIDAAMAGVLSWEARTDAVASGVGVNEQRKFHGAFV